MREILDKEVVKDLYIKGYNYKEIANKLEEVKQETVRKCIQRNFKDLQETHKRHRFINKEKEKALNHMSKKYMSDEALIDWCRQSFTTVCNSKTQKTHLIYDPSRGLKPADLPSSFCKQF